MLALTTECMHIAGQSARGNTQPRFSREKREIGLQGRVEDGENLTLMVKNKPLQVIN
jgi:hypothetical protein